jgi:hypothetical protein
VKIERSEVLSIFRKWLDESTRLFCELRLRVGSAGIEGLIVSVTEDLIVVRSDDGCSEVRVDLDLPVCFAYEDTRKVPAESDRFDAGIFAFFDDPDKAEDPELAAFVEMRAAAS